MNKELVGKIIELYDIKKKIPHPQRQQTIKRYTIPSKLRWPILGLHYDYINIYLSHVSHADNSIHLFVEKNNSKELVGIIEKMDGDFVEVARSDETSYPPPVMDVITGLVLNALNNNFMNLYYYRLFDKDYTIPIQILNSF